VPGGFRSLGQDGFEGALALGRFLCQLDRFIAIFDLPTIPDPKSPMRSGARLFSRSFPG
jgi:hypothetical protein